MKLEKIICEITGDTPSFNLEHRVFNMFAFLLIIVCFFSGVVNYILSLNTPAILAPLLYGMIQIYLYYLSRTKHRLEISVLITLSFAIFIISPTMWIFNGGSHGASQYAIIILGAIIGAICTGRKRVMFLCCFLIMLSSLVAVEYYFPSLIHDYHSSHARYLDVLLSLNITTIATYMLFLVYSHNYRSEREKVLEYSKKLEIMAVTDGLTELYNHNYIFLRLEEEISKAKRYRRKLSIIMLDIDHFKNLNDTYGHQFGDHVLSQVSKCLKNNLRNTDIIGRYGGEEFLIIAPETGLSEAFAAANKLRMMIGNIVFHHHIRVTISMGIAEWKNENSQQLIERADRCLYRAKKHGRNKIEME